MQEGLRAVLSTTERSQAFAAAGWVGCGLRRLTPNYFYYHYSNQYELLYQVPAHVLQFTVY